LTKWLFPAILNQEEINMRTIKTNVYKFDELSDAAKEVARNWYREGALDYDWWDFTYEDAEAIGLKIESFDCDRHEIEGHLTKSINEVCKRILANHGKTCETYKIAKENINVRGITKGSEAAFEFEYSLLQEYLSMLRQEAEYLLSDESVDETILANEYEFTKDGKRA
jgi:hypothetical protein